MFSNFISLNVVSKSNGNNMRETLLGIAPEDGQKPEIYNETVIHYNSEGDEDGKGEVYYYIIHGVKYVTQMEDCDEVDLGVHFKGEWHFDN